MEDFESDYGTVDSKEEMFATIYGSKQGKSEDITPWSCILKV